MKYDKISTSFNGRFFSTDFSSVKHPVVVRFPTTIWRPGGLTEYWMLHAGISSFVTESLNLSQSSTDPRIWVNDKNEVILKFEQIVGPIRSEVREPYYRQPIVQRWIIKKEELLILLKKYPSYELRKWREKTKFKME